ncbi:uncharacterized protein LOC143350183 [Colletes latitarsis]|uniref:uncharacterized protein LOC143350183 n=1 Tax=Colletes latitarsis TaxID=2605962 RepID=UPI004035AE5D
MATDGFNIMIETRSLQNYSITEILSGGSCHLYENIDSSEVSWDKNILTDSALNVRILRFNRSSAYLIFMILTVYVMFIFEPRVLDIISPLNETRPLKSLFPAEFFVDEQEYFALITVISILVCFFIIIILVAFDTMLITYVQYICGMLAVVGYRLEYTLYKCNGTEQISISRQRKKYSLFLTDCVRTHRKALDLIDLLDSTFTLCQLIVLGLNVLCLTITLTVMLLGSFEMCRYALYAFGQLLHVFYVSYQSEKLIDHSLSITKKIYYGNWYTVPKETQRMLLFMLMRSSKPSYITAGKIFVYSMQNFSMVVQNCMSYFMVLASFQ